MSKYFQRMDRYGLNDFGFVTDFDFSPDSNWLAASHFNSATYVWDIGSEDFAAEPTVWIGTLYYEMRSVKFYPDGDWLAATGGDGKVRLWNYSQGNFSNTSKILGAYVGSIPHVDFSSDGKWLMSYDRDSLPHLWRYPISNPEEQIILEGQRFSAFSPDGSWLASGSLTNTIRLYYLTESSHENPYYYDYSSGLYHNPFFEFHELKGHEDAITAFAFSPDNHWLASSSADASIRLWDLGAFDLAANPTILHNNLKKILHSALSPDGHWLATVSAGGAIQLWDMTKDMPNSNPVHLAGPESEITAIKISKNNQWLAIGSEDGSAWLWNMQNPVSNNKPIELSQHLVRITDVAFSQDNRWLVTGSLDLTARLWDLKSSDPSKNYITLSGHGAGITQLAVSSDGKWLATGSMDNTVRLWDITSSDPSANPLVLIGHEGEISDIAFDPDGHWLATGGKDNTIRLWDIRSNDPSKESIVLDGGGQEICCLAFSPDGRWLASGIYGQLWDLGQITSSTVSLTAYKQYEHEIITAFAFSPDGHWLARSNNYEGSIYIVDMQSQDLVDLPYTLPTKGEEMGDMVFSPDGRIIIAGGIWRFYWDDLYELGCDVTGRNLTKYEWDTYFPGEPYHKTCEQWPGNE
jgi:WD40 repeat protein